MSAESFLVLCFHICIGDCGPFLKFSWHLNIKLFFHCEMWFMCIYVSEFKKWFLSKLIIRVVVLTFIWQYNTGLDFYYYLLFKKHDMSVWWRPWWIYWKSVHYRENLCSKYKKKRSNNYISINIYKLLCWLTTLFSLFVILHRNIHYNKLQSLEENKQLFTARAIH